MTVLYARIIPFPFSLRLHNMVWINRLDGFEAKAVTKKVYVWFSVSTLSLTWSIMLIRSTPFSDAALAPFSASNMSRI